MFADPQWMLALTAKGIGPGTLAMVIAALVVSVSLLARWVKAGERPAMLIRDGRVDGTVLRRCRVSDDALHTALLRQGLRTFSEVERAYVDDDGVITMVAKRHAVA